MDSIQVVPQHHAGQPISAPMSNPPSAKAILQLYASMLRTSRSFSSYNFREYFLRRTKSTFKEMQVCKTFADDTRLTRLIHFE